jgi:arylsulfatase A-like enzyme
MNGNYSACRFLIYGLLVGVAPGCGQNADGPVNPAAKVAPHAFAMASPPRGGFGSDDDNTEKREVAAKADPPPPPEPPVLPPLALELSKQTTRPNILLLVADDLGYSDVHAFGGEIDTPNLDALVGDGRILTNHHSGTVSAIARAMLISGTDHHLVGEGTMGVPSDERRGLPGYEGSLNSRSLSVAELLHDTGYHTYITGKWHLGSGIVGSAESLGKSPDQWGFERSYTLLGGAAANHFAHEKAGATNFAEDGVYVQPGQTGQPGGPGGTPAVFYSTDFYTQKLIEYIDSNHGDGQPFFAFASYTSPHWPLQVPEPWLSKIGRAHV